MWICTITFLLRQHLNNMSLRSVVRMFPIAEFPLNYTSISGFALANCMSIDALSSNSIIEICVFSSFFSVLLEMHVNVKYVSMSNTWILSRRQFAEFDDSVCLQVNSMNLAH